ncbi:MAG: sulfotransferase [Sulfuritalea sp.]|nr:sulfotransferase [Sulfuritalea sp.]
MKPTFPAKVFGLGLSRTGTTSLHIALVLLGIPSIHYPADAASHWLSGRFDTDPLADFDACCDLPTPTYFRQLDLAYPGSKFILTTRDIDNWLDSAERHFSGAPPPSQQTLLRDFIRVATYGVYQFDRGRFRDVYERHHDAVRRYFADRPQDILELAVTSGQGWADLCTFVEKPAPDMAFPKLRSPFISPLDFVKRGELVQKQALLLQMLANERR